MNISSQCMRSAWIVFMMVVMIAVLNIFMLAHNKLSTIMSFKNNDSVFTILLMGAVFYPWIFMMVLMVQVVEYSARSQ